MKIKSGKGTRKFSSCLIIFAFENLLKAFFRRNDVTRCFGVNFMPRSLTNRCMRRSSLTQRYLSSHDIRQYYKSLLSDNERIVTSVAIRGRNNENARRRSRIASRLYKSTDERNWRKSNFKVFIYHMTTIKSQQPDLRAYYEAARAREIRNRQEKTSAMNSENKTPTESSNSGPIKLSKCVTLSPRCKFPSRCCCRYYSSHHGIIVA